jgi:signal transduction histidine kinase
MWRLSHLRRRVREARQSALGSGLGGAWARRRPLGIRAQLTLLYTAIFAVLFLLVAGVYYAALERTLQANFDATLTTRAAQIATGVSLENGVVTIQDVTGELPGNVSTSASGNTDTPATPTETPLPSVTQGPQSGTTGTGTGTGQNGAQSAQSDVQFGALVRILNVQGATVYVSPGFKALTVPVPSVSDPLHGVSWLGTVIAHDGAEVRIESIPLRDNGQVYGVLQVGEPATSLHETLGSVAFVLFGVAPLLLLLGAGGSYWLARRALRPVVRLTASAREIEAHDLHRRVPVPAAQDEVHALALTLNGMIAGLERAFEQQRRFVADASHELRTPVAAIQSLTDVALAQPGDAEEAAETLRAVNSEAQRLGALISDLLALARADEGHAHLERELVRLDLLAGDVAAVVEPLAAEGNVTLDLRLMPVTVLGDDARLIQLALNLLDNAVRYTPAGGQVTLEVGAESAAASGGRNSGVIGSAGAGQAVLRVRDTGQGIAPEHLPHIFERFYRTDPARTHSAATVRPGADAEFGIGGTGGSGLGLAIVEWVARAHGGVVAVESTVGVGTNVTVRLPLASAPMPDQPPAPRASSKRRSQREPAAEASSGATATPPLTQRQSSDR